MYEALRLVDLAPIKVPVFIGEKEYTLCEATEGVHVAYQNALMRATKFTSEEGGGMKPTSIDGMADAEPLLVAGCLFENKIIGNESRLCPIPESAIRSWPHRLVKPIFVLAKKISGIDEEEDPKTAPEAKEEEAKNS